MLTGQLTEKSDVYGFGVVLLELISGQEAINKGECDRDPLLIEWVCPLHFRLLFVHLTALLGNDAGWTTVASIPIHSSFSCADEASTGSRRAASGGGSISRRQVQLRMHVENSGAWNDVCGAPERQQTHHYGRGPRNPRRNRRWRNSPNSHVAVLPAISRCSQPNIKSLTTSPINQGTELITAP